MSKIAYIIEFIASRNPVHAKKLRQNLTCLGELYDIRAEAFLGRYELLLSREGRDLDFAIECYLKMIADFTMETIRFRKTGQYSSRSFAEVNARVYANPAVMEYYMHGLLLSQFLFKHHYEMFCFFCGELGKRQACARHYLEVGGGHGMQLAEAARVLGEGTTLTAVDISRTSLELARQLTANDRILFVHSDIFKFIPERKFDFITIGEVIEHLEDPAALLRCAAGLLADDGRLFVTAPTNAPAIDHIHLFRNAGEIRQLILGAGFAIETEFFRYAEDMPAQQAEELKVTLLYGATLRKAAN